MELRFQEKEGPAALDPLIHLAGCLVAFFFENFPGRQEPRRCWRPGCPHADSSWTICVSLWLPIHPEVRQIHLIGVIFEVRWIA
jgi:hypothetical protein